MGRRLRPAVWAVVVSSAGCRTTPVPSSGVSDALPSVAPISRASQAEETPLLAAPLSALSAVVEAAPEQNEASPSPSLPHLAGHSTASLPLGYASPKAQTLACGTLALLRLTAPGFEAYSYRTLARVQRRRDGAYTHVVEQPGYGFVLVGSGPSLFFYQANPRFTPLGHLPAIGPLTIWADAQQRHRLWVHYLKDDAVHHFELPRDEQKTAQLLSSVPLTHFDGVRLERLIGGQWLYGAHGEFATEPRLRLIDGARSAWLGASAPQVQGLAPGRGMDVWTIGPSTALRYEIDPLDRVTTSDVLEFWGEPWVAASQGGRLGVLSHRTIANERQWQLQVIDGATSKAPFSVALPAREDGPDLRVALGRSLCLVPGRTWAAVGGISELYIVDYAKGEIVLQR